MELYIVSKRNLGSRMDNAYFLRLNREDSRLEVYKKADRKNLWESYPIREDFDAAGYEVFELHRAMPCIFGGEGKRRTPRGFFNIEKVSSEEYVSPYYPSRGQVKFFGYLVVFEDYFIHSNLYSMEAGLKDFREYEPISLGDKDTSGCVRVAQEDLEWLVENVGVGTGVEL